MYYHFMGGHLVAIFVRILGKKRKRDGKETNWFGRDKEGEEEEYLIICFW